MAFDWGGFMGGIIGTVGAFASAVWAIRHEDRAREPQKRARQIQVGIQLFEVVFYSVPRLHRTNVPNGPALYETINNLREHISKPLESVLPNSFEAHEEMYELIQEIRVSIMNKLNEFFEKLPKGDTFDQQQQNTSYGQNLAQQMSELMIQQLGRVKVLNDKIQGIKK